MSNPTIKALVDDFVTQLEGAIRAQALAAAQAALGATNLKPTTPATAKTSAAPKATAKKPAAKPAKAKAAKRVRRSPADLDRDVGRLVSYVRSNNGVTSEKARAVLGLEKTSWTSTLGHAVASKQLAKKGEKRNTTLHIAGK